MGTALYLKGQTSGSKAQNVPFFNEDISVGAQAGKAMAMTIETFIIGGVPPEIEITFDGQATWIPILPVAKVDANERRNFSAADTDLINFRNATVGSANFGRFTLVGGLD